jgi:hypothetical protein
MFVSEARQQGTRNDLLVRNSAINSVVNPFRSTLHLALCGGDSPNPYSQCHKEHVTIPVPFRITLIDNPIMELNVLQRPSAAPGHEFQIIVASREPSTDAAVCGSAQLGADTDLRPSRTQNQVKQVSATEPLCWKFTSFRPSENTAGSDGTGGDGDGIMMEEVSDKNVTYGENRERK